LIKASLLFPLALDIFTPEKGTNKLAKFDYADINVTILQVKNNKNM